MSNNVPRSPSMSLISLDVPRCPLMSKCLIIPTNVLNVQKCQEMLILCENVKKKCREIIQMSPNMTFEMSEILTNFPKYSEMSKNIFKCPKMSTMSLNIPQFLTSRAFRFQTSNHKNDSRIPQNVSTSRFRWIKFRPNKSALQSSTTRRLWSRRFRTILTTKNRQSLANQLLNILPFPRRWVSFNF